MIDTEVKGIKEIEAKIAALPVKVAEAGVEYSTNYLLGVLVNKEIPRYKYASRAAAYPNAPAAPGWFSEKQRRYVMMLIKRGDIKIPYTRAGKAGGIQSRWKIEGTGVKLRIVNDSPEAVFLYDDRLQARQPAMVGWKKIGVIIAEYNKRMLSSFDRGVKAAIKRLRL
jgi:hypothetical protein